MSRTRGTPREMVGPIWNASTPRGLRHNARRFPSGHNKAGKSVRLQGGGRAANSCFHPFAAGLVAILRWIRCSVLRLGGGIDHRRQRRIALRVHPVSQRPDVALQIGKSRRLSRRRGRGPVDDRPPRLLVITEQEPESTTAGPASGMPAWSAFPTAPWRCAQSRARPMARPEPPGDQLHLPQRHAQVSRSCSLRASEHPIAHRRIVDCRQRGGDRGDNRRAISAAFPRPWRSIKRPVRILHRRHRMVAHPDSFSSCSPTNRYP